ncbi:MAG: hypothetical protein MUE55_05035 [Thermoplasmata archaeon]|jgi:hypothetical protein|nr:hypothetical protein [Thermoplasmata archaeon]
MKRRLAVPIALCNVGAFGRNTMTKQRTLKASSNDPDDYHVLATLASNRARIQRLAGDLEHIQHDVDCADVLNELEYLKADIELGLMEISAEIEDAPSPEDIVSQEAEAVYA